MRQRFQRRRIVTAGVFCLAFAGCTTAKPAPGLPGPDIPVRYACGDRAVAVSFVDEGVRLAVDGRTHALTRTRSASGARYADAAGAMVFWDRGERALVSLDGQRLPECRREPGSLYTASGDEPGWRLSIGPVRLRLEADYGARIVEVDTPSPEPGPAGASLFRHDGQDLTVRIERRYCENVMSGKPFPDTVSVKLGEERLDGCGGEPATLLTGGRWRIDTLDGQPVPASAAPTVAFGTDGSIAGFDGCNRFRGRFRITGIGIEFPSVSTTRMACPVAAQQTARRFHGLLAEVELFRLDGQRRLILSNHRQPGAAPGIVAVRHDGQRRPD